MTPHGTGQASTADMTLGRDLAVSVALGKATWLEYPGRIRGRAVCATCGGEFNYEARVGQRSYLIHDSHCTCDSTEVV